MYNENTTEQDSKALTAALPLLTFCRCRRNARN